MAKDPRILIEHLVAAERHVTIAQQHIRRQRELIVALEVQGQDTTISRDLLSELEKSRHIHEIGRNRLRTELGLQMVPPA